MDSNRLVILTVASLVKGVGQVLQQKNSPERTAFAGRDEWTRIDL